MTRSLTKHARRLTVAWLLMVGLISATQAQNTQKVTVSGTVFEINGDELSPLDYATVMFPDYAIGTTTGQNGKYTLANVPTGKTRMQVKFLGKLPIDTLVNLSKDTRINFTMKSEDFRVTEIVVTAQNNRAGQATASNISRTAMDHLQATSLNDLMALLPGERFTEPNLSSAKSITIRGLGSSGSAEAAMNALGTAVIRNGAPISNNSNMQALSPTVSGSATAIGGGASPGSGSDIRSISTENIESIEVIRGVPSVEYGDLTSGAVIIHEKAGRAPLNIKAKANPKVYQGSVGTGFELGKNKGSLNLSGDYAYNVTNPTSAYIHYQRLVTKALYSNVFFHNKLRSNTSLDFSYQRDAQDLNEDDLRTQTESSGKNMGVTLNTNGTWTINQGWLKNIRYVASGTYTSRKSYYQTLYSNASAPYSVTTTDGTVLSNTAGEHLFDAAGNEITHFSGADAQYKAVFLPESYVGHYNIDGKEVNLYAKLSATLFKAFGNAHSRILLGADFKADGNEGDGKTFEQNNPPYRNLQQKNAAFRMRPYKDIPYVKQVGAFVEENFHWDLGRRELNLQAGLRYDHVNVAGGVFSPRFNGSFDIIPEVLTLRGGYGITAKMPTLAYLYPENAYFEYINLNELANESIEASERKFVTTTKVVSSQNPDLKIATNRKAEIGFDLRLGQVTLNVTGFTEHLRNGYSLGQTVNTFLPFVWNTYGRNADGLLELTGSYPVLSDYYTPTNNLRTHSKGVEFDLNIGRIESIRTSFQLNGSWMRTESYNTGYDFYDNSSSGASQRTHVAIYEGSGSKAYAQQLVTTLRATHNLPQIGLVMTVSAQAVWNESDWTDFFNDSIPIGYIDVNDAQVKMFGANQFKTTDEVKAAGYDYLLQQASHTKAIKESVSPYFCFNMNVTKEIGKFMRVSFFANNMFRSYPQKASKRYPGTYLSMNNRFYFGLELALTL